MKDLNWFIKNLPQTYIPHKVSSTDYIHVKPTDVKGIEGWCTDYYERYILRYNGCIIFQRYSNRNLLMITSDGYTYREYTSDFFEKFYN